MGWRPSKLDLALLAAWGLLVAGELGWLPGSRYAWALSMWRHFPPWVGAALGAVALAFCLEPVRVRVADRLAGWTARLGAGRPALALVGTGCLIAGILWLARARHVAGDSMLLMLSARAQWRVVPQEPGASFLIHNSAHLSQVLGVGGSVGENGVQLLVCLLFVPTLWVLHRTVSLLVPRRLALACLAVLLTGGMLRVFAGHIEVYAPLLLAGSGVIWAALARVQGRCAWWLPPAALGAAAFVHGAAVLLAPAVAALPWLEDAQAPGACHGTGARIARMLVSGAVAAATGALLLALVLLGAGDAELSRFFERVTEIAGGSAEPGAKRWWVRFWGGAGSVGTDVVWLSPPHLKFLINEYGLLVPGPLALLAAAIVRHPRRLFETREARLLWLALAPLAAYSTLLRPFWGPWDWDLFSLPALVLALLALHLFARVEPEPLCRQLATAIVAFQLCFFSLPFVATGLGDFGGEGPYAPMEWDIDLMKPMTPAPPSIAPWL